MVTTAQTYVGPTTCATFIIQSSITSGRSESVSITVAARMVEMVRSIPTLNGLRCDLRDWSHAYLRTCGLSFPNYELECFQANSQLLDQFLADLIDANLANLSKPGRVAPFNVSGWMADVILDVTALENLSVNLRVWFDAYRLVWEFGVTPSNLERSTEYYKLLSALLVDLIDFNLSNS